MANVAKSYAIAIYELDKEEKIINTIENMNYIQDIISKDNELQKFLSHPLIHSDQKKKAFVDLLKIENKNVINLFNILLDNNCSNLLPSIIKEYQVLKDEENNIIHMEVITASKMNSSDKSKLLEELEKLLNKQIVLEEKVDKNNLGGIVLKYQGKILNASLLQKQEDLKEFLLK